MRSSAPALSLSLARSVPGLSPTELLIAAPTNSFRTCGTCQHAARSRFAPCPSRLSSRMLVGNLGKRPTFYLAYQAYTAILGWPTLEAMEHWLDSHASAPSAPRPICLLPSLASACSRLRTFSTSAGRRFLVTADAATDDPRTILTYRFILLDTCKSPTE